MASKWWTLLVVCLSVFMLLLDVTIVNVALPGIQRELGSSFEDLQRVVDAYALVLVRRRDFVTAPAEAPA
jgi:MFS family permease